MTMPKLLLTSLHANAFPESIRSASLRSKKGLGSAANHRIGQGTMSVYKCKAKKKDDKKNALYCWRWKVVKVLSPNDLSNS